MGRLTGSPDPDEPVAEAADPVNPDGPPDIPSGDDLYDAMLEENREAGSADDGDGGQPP